jgi:hypothetical protein
MSTCNSEVFYKLACVHCHKSYIGETDRTLLTKFKEYIQRIRYNKDDSKFALYVTDNGHCNGTVEQTAKILNMQERHDSRILKNGCAFLHKIRDY